jgi:hypothetical protein
MKRVVLCVFAASMLVAAFAIPAMADIPLLQGYRVIFHRVDGALKWEYIGSEGSNWGLPIRGEDGVHAWWHIPNHYMPNYKKTVYWEVDWQGLEYPPTAPDIHLRLDGGIGDVVALPPMQNPANNSWTQQFNCTVQPGSEEVYWAADNQQYRSWFFDLEGVERLELLTECTAIPEPSSLPALLVGMAGLTSGMFRRGKK